MLNTDSCKWNWVKGRLTLRNLSLALYSLLIVLSLPGCGGVAPPPPPDPDVLAEGRAFWDAQCAFCHGANGEGTPIFDPTPVLPGQCAELGAGGCEDLATLTAYIAETMPPPGGTCLENCASSTAQLILASFQEQEVVDDIIEEEIIEEEVIEEEVIEEEVIEEEVIEEEVIEEEVIEEEVIEEEVEELDPQLLAQGRANWDAQCAFCHGANGEGAAIDPSPVRPGECTVPDAGGCEDLDTMAAYIAATMPPPGGTCVDACAESTSALILSFTARSVGRASSMSDNVATTLGWMMREGHCTQVNCKDVSAVTRYILEQTADTDRQCNDECAFQSALEISSRSSM
jgi:mono/diheme cytochrome c family protein